MDSDFDIVGVLLVSIAMIFSASWVALDAGAELGIVFSTALLSIPMYAVVGLFVFLIAPPLISWVMMHIGLSLIVWKRVIVHLAKISTPSSLSEGHYSLWGENWIYMLIGFALITLASYLTWKDRFY